MRRIEFSNKTWALLLAALAAVCVGVICLLHVLPRGSVAVIYENGKEVSRVDLSLVTESYTIALHGNTILVEPGKISMQSATCPDKLCIRQGSLHAVGRIVCLPNRVVIEMQRRKDAPDAKVG